MKTIKLFMFLITLWSGSIFCASHDEHECLEPYFYRVSVAPQMLTVHFKMESDWYAFGYVEKALSLRSHYTLYNAQEAIQGRAFSRFFYLGAFFEWAIDLSVSDEKGVYIGRIKGEKTESRQQKFLLFNALGECDAIAYVDDTNVSFVRPENENYTIAMMIREEMMGPKDVWEVYVYDPMAVDPRLMKLFSAFITDCYNK